MHKLGAICTARFLSAVATLSHQYDSSALRKDESSISSSVNWVWPPPYRIIEHIKKTSNSDKADWAGKVGGSSWKSAPEMYLVLEKKHSRGE